MADQCQHDLSLRISPPQNGVQRIECGECGQFLRDDPVGDIESGWPK